MHDGAHITGVAAVDSTLRWIFGTANEKNDEKNDEQTKAPAPQHQSVFVNQDEVPSRRCVTHARYMGVWVGITELEDVGHEDHLVNRCVGVMACSAEQSLGWLVNGVASSADDLPSLAIVGHHHTWSDVISFAFGGSKLHVLHQ